jgi:hypothetical protein
MCENFAIPAKVVYSKAQHNIVTVICNLYLDVSSSAITGELLERQAYEIGVEIKS